MTQASCPQGLLWPSIITESANNSMADVSVLDAAGEMVAFLGYVFIEGRAASKTLSAAGGGSIGIRLGSVTFANGATTVDVGLQDVATGTGPAGQPDGTFDVKNTFTGGTGTLAAGWNTCSMTGGSGTKTLSNGDLIAVVINVTARGGADTLTPQGSTPKLFMQGSDRSGFPLSNFNVGGWQTAAVPVVPNCLITFDDGTLGTLSGSAPFSQMSAELFTDADNPDEYGLVFQVPWNCKVDALFFVGGAAAATGDFDISLYSAPTTAASALVTKSITAEMLGGASVVVLNYISLATEISLTRNTDYCVALKATGAGNVRLGNLTLASATHRKMYSGSTTLAKATRNGGSGNFSTTTTTLYNMGVRISSFDDGTGAGVPAQLVNSQGLVG